MYIFTSFDNPGIHSAAVAPFQNVIHLHVCLSDFSLKSSSLLWSSHINAFDTFVSCDNGLTRNGIVVPVIFGQCIVKLLWIVHIHRMIYQRFI